MIPNGGGGGMVSNYHLVLFTNALCQLSYPSLTLCGQPKLVERPAGRHLRVRRCGKQITTGQQRPSRHTGSSKAAHRGYWGSLRYE
jgi:hypothetical protein